MQGSCFKFSIGNKIYQSTNDLWKSLFGITVIDDEEEEEEVGPLVTNSDTHVNFDWGIHVDELLKAPCFEDYYDPISTSQLKMVPRIML